jgi:hypothetical protein
MAEEKKEFWQNYLSITTVIMAVCATLATFKAGGYSTQRVVLQTLAADQWAYFQAKNIRSNMYLVRKESLEFELDNLPTKPDDRVLANYKKAIDAADARVKRYDAEKAEIMAEAKKIEHERDDAQRRGGPFQQAIIFLQIGILLSAVAALTKRKVIWYCSLPLGVWGLVNFADGFLSFM